jgi:transposase
LSYAIGQACDSAAARQVELRFGLAASTVRAIDLRYLERWAASRRKPGLAQMGVNEIHLGRKQKFLTVVSNLDSAEPVWFGRERKKETLDEFFEQELSRRQRRITAAGVDMWEPYRLSIEQHAPNCHIVYDKFHVDATRQPGEVRRAESSARMLRERFFATESSLAWLSWEASNSSLTCAGN